jgi:hypothetical protein
MALRDGAAFLAFDEVVRRSVPGDGKLEARLRQVVTIVTIAGWMSRWASTSTHDGESPGVCGEPVRTAGGTLRPGSGSFRPSATVFLAGIRDGMLTLAAGLAATLFPARIRHTGTYTAVLGIGKSDVVRNGSDHVFVEFCRRGPVRPLHNPSSLIVQHGEDGCSNVDSSILYARRPLFRLLRIAPAGWLQRLRLALSLWGAMANGLLKSAADPRQAMLLRDRLEAPQVRALVDWGSLGELVISNTWAKRQPLWLREGAVPSSMVWYSENSKWLWLDHGQDAEWPIYRHLSVGEHWVWSEAHAFWLRRVGHAGPIHVVGPLLWYLDREETFDCDKLVAWITVFDITPVSPEIATQVGFKDNYYSTTRCVEFVRGIVDAVVAARRSTGLDIRIRIKPKRVQHFPDRSYGDALAALVNGGAVSVMDSVQDLFEITRGSALSVVQPFSSPAIVAVHVGSRACYFDASADLLEPEDLDPRIPFVQDRDDLAAIIADAAQAWCARRC